MSCKKYYLIAALLCIVTAALSSSSSAKEVSIDRILKEHKVTVATTEPVAKINKCMLNWNMNVSKTIPLSELFSSVDKLEKDGDVLYILDRSKLGDLKPEYDNMLPRPISSFEQNEVLLYVSKTAIKRHSKYKNGWDILILAPNEKWLDYELEQIGKRRLIKGNVEERGSVLDRFVVKRMVVVSNEGKQVAEDWVNRQIKPGGDTIDWSFVPMESFDGASGTDVLFLLNKQKINSNMSSLVAKLPKDTQTWISTDSSLSECAAERANGESSSVAAVVAPSTKHLRQALAKYKSMESIPQALSKEKLTDLRQYGQMLVVVRAGDRSNEDYTKHLNEFAGKITTALSSADTGFQCITRQDLKELVFESMQKGQGELDVSDLQQIRKKSGGARALAVAELTSIDARTSFAANTPSCETERYPEFREPEPQRPHEPKPDDKKLFGGHIYTEVNGSRANDPKYIKDHNNWERDMREYYAKHADWERNRRDYEHRRDSHEMAWVVSVDAIEQVALRGNIRIYDLGAVGDENAGKVLFSSQINGEGKHQNNYQSDRVVVRGELNQPDTPSVPESKDGISDQTVVSDAFTNGCEKAMKQLVETAILPSDIEDDAITLGTNQSSSGAVVEETQRVAVEAIGSAKVSKKPVGEELKAVKEIAMADAYAKLIDNLQMACPGAVITEDQLKEKAVVKSEGYNAKTGEYRIKVAFSGDVTAKTFGGKTSK